MIYDNLVIRVCTNKIYYYGNTRVICDHMNVHVRTNKIYEERAVFSDLIYAGVCSKIACIGYFFILISLLFSY